MHEMLCAQSLRTIDIRLRKAQVRTLGGINYGMRERLKKLSVNNNKLNET